jgi:hypothetical protein
VLTTPLLPGLQLPLERIGPGYYAAAGENNLGRTYDVAPDGKRFLMIKSASTDQGAALSSLVVVQHFDELLKRLVPVQ